MTTLCYFTNRLEPKFEWFAASLHNQTGGNYDGMRLVVVDFYADSEARREYIRSRIKGDIDLVHVPPKPTVWQGPHRLTTQDYFAAANARNTAICLCPDGHIVFVDDLSVLMPGWLDAVREAVKLNKITLGAYRKVKELTVNEDGIVTHHTGHPLGEDVRLRSLRGARPYPCGGNWHFGCSLAAPVEAYLQINGFCEAADGMGYEDCVTGLALARRGWHFQYDPQMMTWESEELHHSDKPMKRLDKGKSPRDKSHALLSTFKNADHFDNWFGPDGIRGLRQRVLAGEPFPVMKIPEHDWYDGQPLVEM